MPEHFVWSQTCVCLGDDFSTILNPSKGVGCSLDKQLHKRMYQTVGYSVSIKSFFCLKLHWESNFYQYTLTILQYKNLNLQDIKYEKSVIIYSVWIVSNLSFYLTQNKMFCRMLSPKWWWYSLVPQNFFPYYGSQRGPSTDFFIFGWTSL